MPQVFLGSVPLVSLLRAVPRNIAVAAAAASVRGGIAAIEVTTDSDHPLGQLDAIRSSVPGAIVGIGTVLSIGQAREAVGAGAAFVVSPHFDNEIVRYCNQEGVPVIPGATTPSEILQAWRAGVELVKVFPAGPLGTAYVRAVSDALKGVDIMATGGITETNLASFFAAGARAATIGSWLFPKEALSAGDVTPIEDRARRLVSALSAGIPA